MSVTDPIADMLTAIRNACRAQHKRVDIPASNLKKAILEVLQREKYISSYRSVADARQGLLRIYLKYGPLGEDVVTKITRVSRPGRRVYQGAEELPRPLNGLGICIVSTSKGILSDRQCRQQHVGGEVLCTVC